MSPRSSLIAAAIALTLIAGACSGTDEAETTTTMADPTSSSSSPTTSAASTTTTRSSSTTTTRPPAVAVVSLDNEAPDEAVEALESFYSWLADPELQPEPEVPEGLLDHLEGIEGSGDLLLRGDWASAELAGGGEVGVAVLGADILLLVDDREGWRVVGAEIARFDREPWFGEPVRHILVIGTDARPGYNQDEFRADSIHILSSVIAESTGAVVGFPRDTYVETPDGRHDKFTHINVDYGGEGMIQVAEELSGLDIDGYLLTGFLGFEQLVNAFDGVPVDVPFAMAEPKSEAYLSAGMQILWGANALAFSRNRTIANGDFRRSLHQGIVIKGALEKVLGEFDILDLPALLAMLSEFVWTDLDAETLLTAAAGAFELDPESIPNVVLPGSIRTIGGASVVALSDGASGIFSDLADGMLTDELPEGALTSD